MDKTIKKIHKLSLFIFRRDLRLEDNTALFHALRLSEQVVPCFIFDINQIDSKKNEYFSHNLVQFMIESLKDLNTQLSEHKSRIFFFHGEIDETFKHMIEEIKPNAVFVNEDVTPYSIKRDNMIQTVCEANSIKFYSYSDMMLVAKDKVLLTGGKFYQKFTPYYRTASTFPVSEPEPNKYSNYYPDHTKIKGEYKYEDIDVFYKKNPELEVIGGRTQALKTLKNMKKFKNYEQIRNYPALETTKLSAYNKFGCLSIRELYHEAKKQFGASCTFIQQLFWRDFYYNVTYYYPHVFGNPMKMKYKDLEFENNKELFEKWKNGMTGCPIVDAAMRHIKTKGYMPNRLRMVVANYLVKDLLIHWKLGEKYFAQTLVDYDPSQNSGGWQWAAGCGTDSQPYFRIFNPKLQSEKFDADCDYILQWIPELKSVEKKHIHDWETFHKLYKDKKIDYPAPAVIHAVQKQKCLKMYKQALYGDDLRGYEEDEEGQEDEQEEEKKEEEEAKPQKTQKTQRTTRKRRASTPKNENAKKTKKTQTKSVDPSKKVKVKRNTSTKVRAY